MRTLIAGLLLTTAFPAFADIFELDTDVTSALITGNGGVVTYSADVILTPGRHTLIAYVPSRGYQDTILDTRVGDPATVRIVSQSATTDFAKPIRPEPSADETAAKTALDAAKSAQRAFEQTYEDTKANLDAANAQLTLLKVTAETGFGKPDNGVNAEQLIAVLAALSDTTKQATRALAAAKTDLATMATQRQTLQDNVDHAQAVLNALQPQDRQQLVQISTQIEVSAAQTAAVTFDNLEEAYWQPTYTAELTQDGTSGKLLLHREASVSVGRAGIKPLDAWGAVDITLSTANLRERTDTYIPRPNLQTLVDANQLRKTLSASGAYNSRERVEDEASAPEPVMMELAATNNSTSFAGQTLLFTIGGKSNIDWTTDTSSFNIDTLSFDVDLYAMANAAQDETAFLYTDLTNDTGGVILAGPVKLHRDGTLIGETRLPQLVPNQDEPIGLGPLYGIQIKRDTLSVEEGDSGFITSKSEVTRSFRTTLTSSLDYDMPVQLLDVIPTSENEDLVIRMSATPRPSDENRDGKRGVLVWGFDLGSKDTETVTFGYEMKWPSGRIPVQN